MSTDQVGMTHDALDALDSVAVVLGLDGSILDANRAALDCYGHSLAEMLSLSIHDLRAPGDQTDIDTRMRQAAKTGVLFEAVHLRGDGSPFPAEVRSVPVLLGGIPALLSFVSDLTAQKRAAEELKDSESRYRSLAETSPLAVFVFRNELDNDKVVLANPACVKLFRASSSEDLIGKSTTELFDSDSRALMRGGLREVGEKVSLAEAEIVRLDGTRATVEVTGSALLDQGIAAIQVVLHDITERKHADEALRLSEEKYASAFHASPDSITITRLNDGKLVEVNEGYERLLGYTRAESIGKTTAELSAYADPGTRDSLVTRLRETGEVKDFDATVRRKDGTSVPVIVSARVLDFEGEECFLAVAHDMTERRRTEEERRRADRFFRDTFEHADVGIAHVNCTDGSWLRVNQRLCDLLGYTREELLATTFAAITHPDDVEQNVRHLHRLLAGEEATYAAEKRYLRKDGSIVWVHMNVAMIRKEDGTPDYNITVVTDITERKRAEEALASSESRLEAMFENAPSGIALIDSLTGRIYEANPAYAKIAGRTVEELRELDWMSITHPADMRVSLDSIALLNDTGATVQMERRLVRPDGSTVWISMTDAPVLVGDAAHPQHVCMIEDITANKEAEQLLARQTDRIERALTSVIDIAGTIGEVRDPYTAGHQKRVAELAARIAQDLGMSDREIADIRVAGLLHDMGKAGVPTEILGKPGAISPTEFELIKGHAEAGYRIAVSANMEEPIPELIYQHHERCDGSGYPRGLLGDQMLPGAKVLAVADVVEAMMSHRPYRPALGIEAAMAEIERGAGSHYDAEVSKVCVALFREGGFEFSS